MGTADWTAAVKKRKRQKLSTRKSKAEEQNKNEVKSSSSKIKSQGRKKNEIEAKASKEQRNDTVQFATAFQQLEFFIHQYQSCNGVQLSSLELDSLKEAGFIELCQGPSRNTDSNLGEHMKVAFGSLWKDVLCEKYIQEGKLDPGNPALLVISLSAIRSLELLRELRPLTKDCHAAKLFSKHMKVEEQVSMLKNRVNVASGTPSRIKKLIDMEALGLSRLAVVVLDMHTDVKGYSLFTLPQVRNEFWDLYESFLHQPLLNGDLRICLYGPVPSVSEGKNK
ncbi:hypothetical protein F511_21524 [Dorcoceras hygrometricum]|uniref:Protein CMSS1 n=1 Tax=Dorcoceras hygrometricum TaxID=472368 RepID=A0A2Z7CB49_9LAMI|nr:hypothetical protein F511_21524 [Dorcoceras hygrometricum]